MRRRILGEDHPDTLASINNLAGTLELEGNFAEARRLQEQALTATLRVHGEEHPNTLSLKNNLAFTLENQGELSGARDLHAQVLPVRRRVLGEEHPDTWSSVMALADVTQKLGDAQSAAEVLDSIASPELTINNVGWLGLRLSVAKDIGAKEDMIRFQRQLRETLRNA